MTSLGGNRVTATMACNKLADPAVTPNLVRRWESDGWLKATGRLIVGGRGRPRNVYDMGDVWAAYGRWKKGV